MTQQEFQKRCEDVFVAQVGDEFYSIEIDKWNNVSIDMSEIDEKGNRIALYYTPNMEERPQALDYLLGKRDDFND